VDERGDDPDRELFASSRIVDFRGEDFVVGRTDSEYAIWRGAGGGPIRTFPLTDEGWASAWATYRGLEDQAAAPSTARLDYKGHRFGLGRERDGYAIWDLAGGPAVRTYPLSDEGWVRAWSDFSDLEPGERTALRADAQGTGPLRPLDMADVIGGATRMMWRKAGPVLGAMLWLIVPFQTLIGVLSVATLERRTVATLAGESLEVLQPAPWVNVVAFGLGLLLVYPLGATVVGLVGLAILSGDRARIASAYGRAFRRLPALIVVTLPLVLPGIPGYLVLATGEDLGLAVLLLLAGALGWVAVQARILFAPLAVAAERRSVFAALARSWRLTSGRFWKIVGVLLLGVLIVFGVSLLFGFLFGLLAGLGTPGPGTYVLSVVMGGLSALLIAPFFALLAMFLYVDARVTDEGFEPEAARRELAGDRG
jgi:Membrane domain of glycerophosphoryl diester phosphodiesterase